MLFVYSLYSFTCQISTRAHFDAAGKIADGVVIGSAIIKALALSPDSDLTQPEKARAFAQSITAAQ